MRLAAVVLVAATLLSTANLVVATHDDVAGNRALNAINCNAYSNEPSKYMNNTCSDGMGGKVLPPQGKGPKDCKHGTLTCKNWKYVTDYAGCASFIQQYDDDATGGKKYCQKECCRRGEYFPGRAPSPPTPDNCIICDNVPSPYMGNMGLTCEVAGENRFYRESRCNNAIENVGPNAGKENPYVFNWRNNKFCQKMCFEAGVGYGDNCCGITPDTCDPATKRCPMPNGSGYYTLTTSVAKSCKFADCKPCDYPQQKTCWNGSVIKKDPNTCQWESNCAECDKEKHKCWDGSWAWPDYDCKWVKECPPPIICPYETMKCWDGSAIGRNAHNCHFPNCPDRPDNIPGYNDIVQIQAVTKLDLDLCMNVRGNSFKEGTIIEFDGCDDEDTSQMFHVRRIYHTDNTRFYIVPKANTNLYVTVVNVDVESSGTQGRLRLQKKGDGKQVFFLDYTDNPTNDVFKMGLGNICYPDDDDCLFVTNNGAKAADDNRIVVRTWNRIEANARSGDRDKTIFGTWKINTLSN